MNADFVKADVLGETITFSHPRFGLSAGKKFTLIGKQLDAKTNEMILTIWG
jgi:hypothetical protein